MARRRNKNGEVHAHSENIQDQVHPDTWPRTPKERALWAFEMWASMAPGQMTYDLLPPAVQMVVSAVGEVAGKLHIEQESV